MRGECDECFHAFSELDYYVDEDGDTLDLKLCETCYDVEKQKEKAESEAQT